MRTRVVSNLSATDAAYLAGLIDGEGTIALTRLHATSNRHLHVSISSTEQALVQWTLDTVGVGKITRKRVASPLHAPGLTYSIANRQALELLRQVTPFLRSYKRRRAALARAHYLAVTPRNGKYNPETRAARARFESEFAAIVARQPADRDSTSRS